MQTLQRVSAKAASHERTIDSYKITLLEVNSLSDEAPEDNHPEEHICMGLAASYYRALKQVAEAREIQIPSLEVTVEISLLKNEKHQLRYEAEIIVCLGNIPKATIEMIVKEAKKHCPVMLSMQRNVKILVHSNLL